MSADFANVVGNKMAVRSNCFACASGGETYHSCAACHTSLQAVDGVLKHYTVLDVDAQLLGA